MPNYNILLNASNCTNISTGGNSFTYNFPANFKIKKNSKIAINQITMPYSWRNVTKAYGNNLIYIRIPKGSSGYTAYAITLSDGFYTINDINTEIQKTLYSYGLYWYSPFTSANNSVVKFTGYFSTSTKLIVDTSLPNSANIQLTVGMWIQFISTTGVLSYTQITALQSTANNYTVSTVTNGPSSDVPLTAFVFNQNQMSIIYPCQFSTSTYSYQNTFTTYTIPLASQVQSFFGNGYSIADGNFGTTAWTNTYPTVSGSCAYFVLPSTSYSTMYGVNGNTTSTLGNLLGWYASFGVTFFPNPNTGLSVNSTTIYSNGLSQIPPFPPVGSNVNAVIIRCNICENEINTYSDVLDNFPITASYGENISYIPVSNNFIKLKEGNYSSMTISFCDQNFNPLQMLDYNVVISLCISMDD